MSLSTSRPDDSSVTFSALARASVSRLRRLVRLLVAGAVAGLGLLAMGAPAHAVTLPPGNNTAFAADDQVVLSDELQFTLKKPSGGDWQLHLQPSLDYFIARHISVGGVISIDAGGGGGSWGFGPRAGFAIPLGERVTFWPMVMIKATHANHNTSTELWLNAPFLFHLVPHFFVGVGPYFMAQMSGGGYSEFGFHSILGGYF